MKARFPRRLLPLWVITVSAAVVSVSGNVLAASVRFWNPVGSGGDGIWGTSPGDKNWNTTPGAATGNTVWPDTGNEVAVFQDALGGTVTVFTPVLAAGIRQQAASYMIDAETVTLVQDNAEANPFIHVQSGTLTIAATLNGSHGLLKTGNGNLVLTAANSYAGTTAVTAGSITLTGNGSLASTAVDIAAGATLTDTNGGLAAGTVLTNSGTLAISAADTVGRFAQTATGTLVSSATLTVSGLATFGGTLQLNEFGPPASPAFLPIHVVAAGAYAGNFATLVENLDGAVWFNPRNGDAMRLASPTPGGNTLFGTTTNQTSAWVALYDDVIDPGVINITHVPGGNPEYLITSGIATNNNPDLLWALATSFTPAGLNPNLLNHLSPEVYVGLSDYAIQATRTHQRSAFSAPALAPTTPSDSKAGCKAAAPNTTMSPWEFFAATDYFHVESSQSHNQADYELSGFGVLGGARTHLTDHLRLAAYLAADAGDINGQLIDADSTGWSLGLLGEALLDEKSHTCLSAGISYGRYLFDGTRSSVAATGGGWSAAPAGFSDVASDALELFVGVDGLLYQHEGFRLIPAFGLHAATGTMDGFTETTGSAPSSPLALVVNRDHYTSVLADLSLRAEADVTNQLTVWGLLGMSAGINDNPHALTARFAKGSRPFQTVADGLSNNSLVVGLGVTYKVNDSISVALGGRDEFRTNADPQTNFCLSSTFRF
ncbi:MAG: autotransporter domain-containing protein [Verrucomicrobiota bacterium]